MSSRDPLPTSVSNGRRLLSLRPFRFFTNRPGSFRTKGNGGYPFSLCGQETPLPARLLAVADAYSAMTMDRPYRKGKRPEDALALLSEGAGRQWDPVCVRAFLRSRRGTSAILCWTLAC